MTLGQSRGWKARALATCTLAGLAGCGDIGVKTGAPQTGYRVPVCTMASGRSLTVPALNGMGAGFRIKNGTEVRAGDCSWVVRLDISYPSGARSLCSGTLLVNELSTPPADPPPENPPRPKVPVVLTAAHCVTPQPPRSISVSQPGLGVSASASHFRAYGGNPGLLVESSKDVAIVYLRTVLQGAATATLATEPTLPKGTDVIAMGYGYDAQGADGNGNLGNLLAGWVTVDIPAATDRNLRTLPKFNFDDPRSQDSCAGDSGGPLVDAKDAKKIYGLLSGGGYRGFPSCKNSSDSYWQYVPQRRADIDDALAKGTQGATALQ